MLVGADTRLCSATKYSMGKSVHLGRVMLIGGRTLSPNTLFPGKTKQFSFSVEGFSSGLAGLGTAGRVTPSPVKGRCRAELSDQLLCEQLGAGIISSVELVPLHLVEVSLSVLD